MNEAEDIASGSGDHELLREMQVEILSNLHIEGVVGIKKVYPNKQSKVKWIDDVNGFDTQLKVNVFVCCF